MKKKKGTPFSAFLKLVTSVAISGVGLYISILWLLRDMFDEPQLTFFVETSARGIFFDIIIPLLLLGLSYTATRDSLFEFFYTLRKHNSERKKMTQSPAHG